MKIKLLTILVLTFGVMSCKKEKQNEPTSCSCVKTKQQIGAGGSWHTISTTQPFMDFCSKDGLIEYEGTVYRHLWSCQ